MNFQVSANDRSPQHTPEHSTDFNNFTLYWENDFFTGTDQDYTNGLKLTWSTAFSRIEDSGPPAWSRPVYGILPFVDEHDSDLAFSISLGQDIYTPQDTESTEVVIDDRPYAGYTYLAAGFHSHRKNRKNTWEIQLGIVGPASQAESVQNFAHDLVDSDRARGWKNQLKNEVTLDFIYESQWRVWSRKLYSNFSFDLIPHMGTRIGMARTYVNGGAELRTGWKLPDDFGSCPIRAGCEVTPPFPVNGIRNSSLHLFVSTDGKYVLHDIFLDGNTFRDSHSVDKNPLVGEINWGIIWQISRIKITYSIALRSKQFDTQLASNHDYGSVSLSYSY